MVYDEVVSETLFGGYSKAGSYAATEIVMSWLCDEVEVKSKALLEHRNINESHNTKASTSRSFFAFLSLFPSPPTGLIQIVGLCV